LQLADGSEKVLNDGSGGGRGGRGGGGYGGDDDDGDEQVPKEQLRLNDKDYEEAMKFASEATALMAGRKGCQCILS
jgi:hypothetical protein